MSRIGKKPILLPEGVTVDLADNTVKIRNSKGELSAHFQDMVKINKKDNSLLVEPIKDKRRAKQIRAYWGLTRKMIQNMVDGLVNGYEKKLTIEGIGYRAQVQGNKLIMTLGLSHPVEMEVPAGLKVAVADNVNITVTGIDRYLVGQFTAMIRDKKPPEPYKGKGIRYATEIIKRKVGKTGV